MSENLQTFSAEEINRFSLGLLLRHGVSEKCAKVTADVLTETSLSGIDSHGIRLLPIYLKRLKLGLINKDPSFKVTRETAAFVAIDGDNGLGQYVAHEAMSYCIQKTKSSGEPTICQIKRSNHFGAAAIYAKMAADENLISLVTSNGSKAMVPWGGSQPYFGANPLAFAVPTGDASKPILFDMASSAMARAKIRIAAESKTKIPDHVAVDHEGNITNDPEQALSGALLPMAGPKGYGLVLLFEILAGVLSGAKFGLESGGLYEDLDKEQGIGHFMMTLPINFSLDTDSFFSRIQTLSTDIREMKPAPGLESVLLPGDRSREKHSKRSIEGISLNEPVVRELLKLGAEVGLTLQ